MGKPMDRKVLVIDVESTCWEPPEVQPRNEISEIIEIGIAEVDIDNLEIIRNECILVRPQNSRVSKFCTKLTTLTQEMVDQGITFQSAMNTLRSRYDSSNRVMVSWGDYDRKIFQSNCETYECKYPFGPRHMNLKNTFAIFHGLGRECGLDAALPHFGLKLEGTHHRGIDDAKNIAKIFIAMNKFYRAGAE